MWVKAEENKYTQMYKVLTVHMIIVSSIHILNKGLPLIGREELKIVKRWKRTQMLLKLVF